MPIIRPQTFDQFIGQEAAKKQAMIAIRAATERNVSIPHVLLSGPPGTGKTTFANIMANEMKVDFAQAMAGAIKNEEEFYNIICQAVSKQGYEEKTGKIIGVIKPNCLFLDEVHQLKKKVQEWSYPVMEDFKVMRKKITTNQFSLAKEQDLVQFTVPYFTLIGATTEVGALEKPFRDRFGLILTFKHYTEEEVEHIVKLNADACNVPISDDALTGISKRARGVARVAISHFSRCLDFAVAHDETQIDNDVVEDTYAVMGVDSLGLTEQDLKVMTYLAMTGRPIGLATLAEYLGESQGCVADLVEPYLIRKELITRTPGGRIITPLGVEYLRNGGKIEEAQSVVIGRD